METFSARDFVYQHSVPEDDLDPSEINFTVINMIKIGQFSIS